MERIESIRDGRTVVTYISEGRLEEYELPSGQTTEYRRSTPRQAPEPTGLVGRTSSLNAADKSNLAVVL